MQTKELLILDGIKIKKSDGSSWATCGGENIVDRSKGGYRDDVLYHMGSKRFEFSATGTNLTLNIILF
ncbi:hypothetical protein Hdeb2414_s0044g00742501 [Helianthus debilis subsp. tardiflorus]